MAMGRQEVVGQEEQEGEWEMRAASCRRSLMPSGGVRDMSLRLRLLEGSRALVTTQLAVRSWIRSFLRWVNRRGGCLQVRSARRAQSGRVGSFKYCRDTESWNRPNDIPIPSPLSEASYRPGSASSDAHSPAPPAPAASPSIAGRGRSASSSAGTDQSGECHGPPPACILQLSYAVSHRIKPPATLSRRNRAGTRHRRA